MNNAFMCTGCDHVWTALLSHNKASAVVCNKQHVVYSISLNVSLDWTVEICTQKNKTIYYLHVLCQKDNENESLTLINTTTTNK